MHTPHPPSKHINLVPCNSACVRMNVFNDVSTGIVGGDTEKEQYCLV